LVRDQVPTGYKLVQRELHACNGLQPWITSRPHDHITMVSGMGRLVKPCAYGAPQAASGLDQPPHPGARL